MFKGGKLKCPHCKCDDLTEFSHIEYVAAQRPVSEIKDGVLIVDGTADYNDEDNNDSHLWCGDCCKEFAIPIKLDVEFV